MSAALVADGLNQMVTDCVSAICIRAVSLINMYFDIMYLHTCTILSDYFPYLLCVTKGPIEEKGGIVPGHKDVVKNHTKDIEIRRALRSSSLHMPLPLAL